MKKREVIKVLVKTPYGSLDVMFPGKEKQFEVVFVYDDDSRRVVTVFDPEQVVVQRDPQVRYD